MSKQNISFKWNKTPKQIRYDKGIQPQLSQYFGKLIQEFSYDYVPYSYPEDNDYNGQPLHLADLVTRNYKGLTEIGYTTDVVYTKDYARLQYYGDYNHGNQMHMKATKQWSEVAWQQNKSSILSMLKKEQARLSKT